MKLFEFTKYFFDILTAEGNYLLFFISILKIGRIYNSYLQINSSETDSSGKFSQGHRMNTKIKLIDFQLNKISFREGSINLKAESVNVHISAPSFEIDLNYRTVHPESGISNPFFIKRAGNASLAWIPLQIKGLVDGSISTDGRKTYYENATGYIDMLKTSILPVNMHIRKLLWGRLHNEIIDLTYTLLLDEFSKADSLLIFYYKGTKVEFTDIEYHIEIEKTHHDLGITYPEKLRLSAKNNCNSITIDLSDHKELVFNEFMDPGDHYNKAFFGIMRRISKNPRGIKFFARADLLLEDNISKTTFRNLFLINEFVTFSK